MPSSSPQDHYPTVGMVADVSEGHERSIEASSLQEVVFIFIFSAKKHAIKHQPKSDLIGQMIGSRAGTFKNFEFVFLQPSQEPGHECPRFQLSWRPLD